MPDVPIPDLKSAVRIGVYSCHCGTNIAATVDVKALAEYAATLPNVVISRDYKYMCSEPGQDLIRQDIRDHGHAVSELRSLPVPGTPTLEAEKMAAATPAEVLQRLWGAADV